MAVGGNSGCSTSGTGHNMGLTHPSLARINKLSTVAVELLLILFMHHKGQDIPHPVVAQPSVYAQSCYWHQKRIIWLQGHIDRAACCSCMPLH